MAKLTKLEGIASNIRTDTSVQGSISRGKGSVSSTTTMNFLIDGKAVNADFGESMNINNGDHVVVAGLQKTNGLNALAYNNVTNGTYGEGGRTLRIVGIIAASAGIIAGMLIIPLLLIPIGIGAWWAGRRSKIALALCRQTSATARAPSAA
jgi:hypothetical protein